MVQFVTAARKTGRVYRTFPQMFELLDAAGHPVSMPRDLVSTHPLIVVARDTKYRVLGVDETSKTV